MTALINGGALVNEALTRDMGDYAALGSQRLSSFARFLLH
jgi:hypothetical protein